MNLPLYVYLCWPIDVYVFIRIFFINMCFLFFYVSMLVCDIYILLLFLFLCTYLSTRLVIYLFVYFCSYLFIDMICSCLYKISWDSLLFVATVGPLLFKVHAVIGTT
jgi:hypothetical protein